MGPISIQLMYGNYLTQACYNVYNTVTTPNALSVFNLNVTNTSISAVNSAVRLAFLNVNPFPRSVPGLGNRIMVCFCLFLVGVSQLGYCGIRRHYHCGVH